MKWFTKILNRISDKQEKLSPADLEEAERKSKTIERAELKQLEEERKQNIRDKAEKFRLPGGRGDSSYKGNGTLEYSNEKIKQIAEKEKKVELLEEKFIVPDGMTPEEATREMIRRDAEKYGIKQLPKRKQVKVKSRTVQKRQIHFLEETVPEETEDENLLTTLIAIFSVPFVITILCGGPIALILIYLKNSPDLTNQILSAFNSFLDPLVSIAIWIILAFVAIIIGFIFIMIISAIGKNSDNHNSVFRGPRGGLYRINSNGRKSYDIPPDRDC